MCLNIKPTKVEEITKLPENVYIQLEYELVHDQMIINKEQLDEILCYIYKYGRYNTGFLNSVIKNVCGLSTYKTGKLVGYIRMSFIIDRKVQEE